MLKQKLIILHIPILEWTTTCVKEDDTIEGEEDINGIKKEKY